MIRRLFFQLAALCILLLPVLGSAATIDKIFVFGDSLSDNGNLYALTHGNTPKYPYWNGRFSNGPVWVEDLAKDLGMPASDLDDYAFGGAQTRGGFFPSVSRQIDTFDYRYSKADPKALYIIWVGANDVIFHSHDPLFLADQHVLNIMSAVDNLHERGAHIFLIVNLPAIDKTPLAHTLDAKAGNHKYSENVAALIKRHNLQLQKSIVDYKKQNPDVTILQLGANVLFNKIIANPEKFNIKVVDKSCYKGNFKGEPNPDDVCSDPDDYLFWDMVHPTRKIHQELARHAKNLLEENGIFAVNSKVSRHPIPSKKAVEQLNSIHKTTSKG